MRMRQIRGPLTLVLCALVATGVYFVTPVPAATMGPVTDPIGVVKVGQASR